MTFWFPNIQSIATLIPLFRAILLWNEHDKLYRKLTLGDDQDCSRLYPYRLTFPILVYWLPLIIQWLLEFGGLDH